MNVDVNVGAGTAEPSRGSVAVAAAACVGIAAILAGRALVAQPPDLWFDVDPASDPFPFAGIAPSTGLFLDSLTLVLSAIAVLAMRRGIDRVGAVLVALAAFGGIPVVLHGFGVPDHLWRGLQWLSAIGAAAAFAASMRAMPAQRSRAARAVVAAILLAAAVPIVARGMIQVWIEHPQMVAEFRAHKQEILAARGWVEGSPQALTYERRLLQPEATAWFGLSNVASSALAACALALTGGALALRRSRPAGSALLAMVAVGAALLVAVNGSKGAIAALVAGSLFALWSARRSPGARLMGRVAVACVALVLVAVALRSVVGERLGERSLLYRAHYVQGASHLLTAHPLIGVGPAGFAEGYLAARPDRSPEEVQSAHSAWADWLASLGILGAAWIALFGSLVALAARATASGPAAPVGEGSLAWSRGPVIAALATLAACMLAIVPEAPSLDEWTLFWRVLAAVLSAAIAGALVRAALVGSRAWLAATAGGVLLLAMHAQVEMTLWWPGSVGRTAAIIGVAAGFAVERMSRDRLSSVLASVAALSFLVPAGVGVIGATRARAAEQVITAAAEPVAAFGLARLKFAPMPQTPLSDARIQCARLLLDHAPNPWLDRPAVVAAALQQLASAVGPGTGSTAARREEALAMAHVALERHRSSAVAGAAALVAESVRDASGGTAARGTHEELLRHAAEQQVAANPRSVNGWSRLADLAAAQGDATAARTAAARALAADDSYELDPMRRIPAAERARLERLAEP